MVKQDWLYVAKLDVTGFKDKIDNIVDDSILMDPKFLSTRGFNSKQYNLTYKKESFLDIQHAVVEEIKKQVNLFNSQFELGNAWTVYGQESSYHAVHRHFDQPNHISTVLYLNVPPEPTLQQPGYFYFFMHDDEGNIIDHIINPQIGDLIIMPSHILHGAYPQSKGTRQTLNMDFSHT